MQRTVSASLDLQLSGPTDLVFAMTVAHAGLPVQESLEILLDGHAAEVRELEGRHGARIHRVRADAGRMSVRYTASVQGRSEPEHSSELEVIEYLRPSRYGEADALAGIARAEFGTLRGVEAVLAVESWVHSHLSYVYGSTVGTGGAVSVIVSRRGVCRDFAHTVVGLLRALDVPARVSAVFAPGLVPMDFHAVAEAWVDGQWYVVDATRLAPRSSMLRISSGRDTADTAFLSSYGTDLRLLSMAVGAECDVLPEDDHTALTQLG